MAQSPLEPDSSPLACRIPWTMAGLLGQGRGSNPDSATRAVPLGKLFHLCTVSPHEARKMNRPQDSYVDKIVL